MAVLITGGGGYLGCRVVEQLLRRGQAVRLFDRFYFGEQPVEAISGLGSCEVVRGDIRRLDRFPKLLDGVDAVLHLAGLANDPSCDLDSDMTLDINVGATAELARRAAEHGIRRFVYVSSCSVYGKGVFETLDEESPTNPVSLYGLSKLQAEQAVLEMAREGLEPVVARPATLFGWSPRMRFDLAINQMVATAERHRRITVFGGGNQWRPFVHVADAARALITMLDAPAPLVRGQVFNLGSDAWNYRIMDLAREVAALCGGVEIQLARDDEDARSYRVQFGKIRALLDFECAGTIRDAVAEIRDSLAADPFDAVYFNVRRMKQLLAVPVEDGGEPTAPRFIPLAKPTLGAEEEQAVIDTLRSGWLTTGATVTRFEQAFAERVGAPAAVAVSSCTAGLHLCLVEAGVKPGDEVISTPLTWISTANTVVNMGARLVLADILPDTLNIDPESVERAITKRTRAIVPVHFAGQPCDLDALRAIARRHRIALVEDAAHALGAAYNGVPIGADGAMTAFSFYPIKNITTIEGGMVTLQDPDAAARLRVLSNNGLPAAAWNRYSDAGAAAPPEASVPGFKYHMSNVSAALGLAQLKKLDSFLAARRRLARMYQTVLGEIDELELPALRGSVEHAWHLMVVRLRVDRLVRTRDEIAHALKAENIGTGVHFHAIHLHPYYRGLGYRAEDVPQATAASAALLSLPLYPAMTDKNVRHVVDALKKVLAHAKKTR